MPKVYRSMRKDEDEKPVIDCTGKGLGARIEPVNSVTDVDLNKEGQVVLNGKGISVAPHWRDLPYFLIPKRLRDKLKAARGSSSLYCFVMGEGEFVEGAVTQELELRIDSETHGIVVPSDLMPADQYQACLAATKDDWCIDED